MATHSSTLAWKILWLEEPGRRQFTGSQRVDMTERLHFFFFLTQDNTGKEILRNTVPSLTELAQQKQHTWLVYSAESFFQMALLHEEVFYWFHKPR